MKRTEHTQKWLDALRSGEYKQHRGGFQKDQAYCCIGVAGEVLVNNPYDCPSVQKLTHMSPYEMSTLVGMNDRDSKTFPEIADAIEQMLNVN